LKIFEISLHPMTCYECNAFDQRQSISDPTSSIKTVINFKFSKTAPQNSMSHVEAICSFYKSCVSCNIPSFMSEVSLWRLHTLLHIPSIHTTKSWRSSSHHILSHHNGISQKQVLLLECGSFVSAANKVAD